MEFQYQKYGESESRLRTVFPHLFKEHRNRWYIIGYELDPPQLRVFDLDRVVTGTLKRSELSFDSPRFDAEAYFRPALGVAVYDHPAEEVVLSFSHREGLRFRAQPFYPFRQENILLDTAEEFRVRLSIIINQELVFELARLGDYVRVLSPPALIDSLRQFHRRAGQQYEALPPDKPS